MPLPEHLFNQFDDMQVAQHPLDWDRELTGKNLKYLREHNDNLARYTCKYSRLWKINNLRFPPADIPCPHNPQYCCSDCTSFPKKKDGTNDVSPRIISREKGLSIWRADQISTLETGKDLTLEKVMLYAFLAQVPLSSILVLKEGYVFDSNGVIVKKEIENNNQ